MNVGAHRSVLRSLVRLCGVLVAGRAYAGERLRPRMPAALALCVLASVLVLMTGAAQAYDIHKYLSIPHITEVPSTGPHGETVPVPGPVTSLQSMKIDEGHLWIAEQIFGTTSSRVDEFNDSTGAFMAQLPQVAGHSGYNVVAAGHTTGEVQVYVRAYDLTTGKPVVVVFSESGQVLGEWAGTSSGSFGNVNDLAADNSSSATDLAKGFVYVLSGSVVDAFRPEAGGGEKFVESFTVSGAEQIAIDQGNGDVAVSTKTTIETFRRVEPAAGTYEYQRLTTITSTPAGSLTIKGIAADTNGEIYAGQPCNSECANPASSAVDEFSLTTGAYLGRTTGQETPEGTFGQPGPAVGLAVDPATHHLFVGVHHEYEGAEGPSVVDTFGGDLVVSDVTTNPATGVQGTSEGTIEATLNGTVNPDGEGGATCAFVWGVSEAAVDAKEHEARCDQAVVNGSSSVPVAAKLSGLQPDVTVYFRLQATNANGTNVGEDWQNQHFKTPGPVVRNDSVTGVGGDRAILAATIDPNGGSTTYYFQYGKTTAYGQDAPALTATAPYGASIGSGEADMEVQQPIEGLAAETTYHYRVVAVSELAGKFQKFAGPDHTFTPQPTGLEFALPDNRAWELVSPPNKHGSLIEPIGGGLIEAAAEGGAISYVASGPVEEAPQGSRLNAQVISRRDAAGWSSQEIVTPNPRGTGFGIGQAELEYVLFSSNLSRGLLEPAAKTPVLTEQASGWTPYLRQDFVSSTETCPVDPSACWTPLVTSKDGYADIEAGAATDLTLGAAKGGTSDLAHVILGARETGILYEWTGNEPWTKRLRVVGVLPAANGNKTVECKTGGLALLANGSTEGYFGMGNAVSSDGSRIFFEVTPAGGCGATPLLGGLYMRDTARGTEGETLQVGDAGATFRAANANGSRVFFTDNNPLTAESGEGDLYLCEVEPNPATLEQECALRDLTPLGSGNDLGLQGKALGAGEDGSRAYFVATAVLPGSGKNDRGEAPEAGKPNLYEIDGATPYFVATLASGDSADWGALKTSYKVSRVSPNGRWLAFMSERPLTGYDNRDMVSGERDEEVYLYDGETHRLACASCNPTGARPAGEQVKSGALIDEYLYGPWEGRWVAATVPSMTRVTESTSPYQSRYVLNNGRLFFDARDSLAPHDKNGTSDVYEYEPPGVGSCTTSLSAYSERNSGCVSLISSGTDRYESAFLDSSENGDDVFFLTAAKLWPHQDYDTTYDVYDAHACSSESPCTPEPAGSALACTEAESCREAPQPQPSVFGPPPSATFSGAGDLAPPVSKLAVKANALTRKQKLARALSGCHKKTNRKKRFACIRRARRQYGSRSSRRRANVSGRGGR